MMSGKEKSILEMSSPHAKVLRNGQIVEVARTACFLTLVLGELLRAYSARSESTFVFKMKVFENGYLNKCVLLSMALILAFIPMLGGELAKLITRNSSQIKKWFVGYSFRFYLY